MADVRNAELTANYWQSAWTSRTDRQTDR